MLTYNNFTYLKPVYTVQAYRTEELPYAFEQMEKLRHSGFLAGYIRRAALHPSEHMLPETPDTPLVKFFLFRARQPLAERPAPERVFCPSVAPLHDRLAQLYAVAAPMARVFAKDLDTACGGREIYDMLAPSFACGGYYRDAFEEVLCLSKHTLVDIDRTALSDEEKAHETPVEELLRAAFGSGEVLVMGCFGRERVEFHGADALLVRHGSEKVFSCLLAGEEAGSDPDRALKELCFPANARISAVTRLEQGCVFLLKEHLARLKELALEHAVDASAVDAVSGQLGPGAPLPLPGDLADFGVGAEACWTALPDSWRNDLAAQGADLAAGPLALTMVLAADGALTVSAAPVPERAPLLGYARKALDERSDLLRLDQAKGLPCEDAARARIESGEWQDALVVNRFAVVCGCSRSDLAFRQGSRFLTPPSDSGLMDGVVRAWLLKKRAVEEREASLAQVLSSQALYCLDSVLGARLVTKVDPKAFKAETEATEEAGAAEACEGAPSAERGCC